MTERRETLPVAAIEYDRENPRIKVALEKYGDDLDAERIFFALKTASEGEQRVGSYEGLKGSIRAAGHILFPIVVIEHDDRFVCIDGNTRLAIYKQFTREGAPGDWDRIPATILTDPRQKNIDAVRISAHLVGAREWPAYEKARYLHHLRNEKLMDYSEMIALCGGRKADIERQIDAFHDMSEFYRDVVDDTAFHIDRFSGFVELQKPRIKEAIYDAGFGLEDFGKWIQTGNIVRLADVRKLPRILADPKARHTFVTGGPHSIEAAAKDLDRREEVAQGLDSKPVPVGDASILRLAKTLSRKIDEMPYSTLRHLQDRHTDDTQATLDELEALAQRLRRLIEDTSA